MVSQSAHLTGDLGPMPSEWDVIRFDDAFSIEQGKQVSSKTRGGSNQRPFLRTKNVLWGRLDLGELDEMHFSETDEARLKLEPGDLLICEGGDVGRTALWKGEVDRCYYQNHLHRARRNRDDVDPEFVLYWLWYAFEVGRVYFGRGNVTTIPNLSKSTLGGLPLPLPPIDQQRALAETLRAIERSTEARQRQVATLMELFRAVMIELMTGEMPAAGGGSVSKEDAAPAAS
jgi:type I restriction enzyme, S subunit